MIYQISLFTQKLKSEVLFTKLIPFGFCLLFRVKHFNIYTAVKIPPALKTSHLWNVPLELAGFDLSSLNETSGQVWRTRYFQENDRPLLRVIQSGKSCITMQFWARLFKTNDVVSWRFVKISYVNIWNTPLFFIEKMWEASFSHFSTKSISVFGHKVVKHLMRWPLNELIKLTMLWTTGPWTAISTSRGSTTKLEFDTAIAALKRDFQANMHMHFLFK